jgi:hypothetical protein
VTTSDTGSSLQPQRSGHQLPWVWITLIVLVLYPLSIGPAYRLSYSYHWCGDRTLEAIYLPIGLACVKSRPVRDVFQWYIFVLWRTPFTGK